jgi:uncharacterized protein YndB with AHSA1/START domain
MTTTAASATQVYRMYIKAPQEKVWETITRPELISTFFHGAQIETTYEIGTPTRGYSPDRSQQWSDGTVLEYDPPRRLVHSWRTLYDPEAAPEPESRVTWEIEAQPDGVSKLTLVHDRLERSPKTAKSVEGWSYILSNLKTVLETGEPLPSAS